MALEGMARQLEKLKHFDLIRGKFRSESEGWRALNTEET
jgi:hypothetical protein